MSEPVHVGQVLPGVLAEVIDRASDRYDRWAELVAQAGYCAHPIRLAGRVEQADRATGELRQVYTTDGEPDGTLLKACGTRRASRCPSCAVVYQADAYQLTAAGLAGGKGVPETIAQHPRLFVTFTAPSFGLAKKLHALVACRVAKPFDAGQHERVGAVEGDGVAVEQRRPVALWRWAIATSVMAIA
jgi:hypothetical protein